MIVQKSIFEHMYSYQNLLFDKKWKPAHWWSQCSSKKLKKRVSVFVPGIPNGGKKLFTNFKFWIWMIIDLRIFYFSKNYWKNTGEQMHLFQHSSVFYQLCNRSNGWSFWKSEFFVIIFLWSKVSSQGHLSLFEMLT